MKIIDCSACIGLGSVNREIVNHEDYPVFERIRQVPDAASLLEEMDFCGIAEAYVYHQAMYDTDPVYGNGRILPEVRQGKDRLHATWTILPPITQESFAPDTLFADMRAHDIRALRAFPKQNRYMLDAITMGPLLDAMIERSIPLYLTPMHNWEHIFDALRAFPSLTVILTNYGLWGSDRYFYPLINAYENVYIDTSDYQVLNGLPAFVGKFGSERLLFGSNMPMDAIGGPLATLFGAGLSAEHMENIAHRNIERVMGRVRL